MLLEEYSKFLQPSFGKIDSPVFSLLQSQIETELTPCVNSPFSCDFGNDNNGFHFLDGTSEQDVSLTELLDEVFHNHDDFSSEESTKNSVAGTGTHLSDQTRTSYSIPPGSSYLNGACSDTNTEMAQVFSSLF